MPNEWHHLQAGLAPCSGNPLQAGLAWGEGRFNDSYGVQPAKWAIGVEWCMLHRPLCRWQRPACFPQSMRALVCL